MTTDVKTEEKLGDLLIIFYYFATYPYFRFLDACRTVKFKFDNRKNKLSKEEIIKYKKIIRKLTHEKTNDSHRDI
jgi:hypothetical protein